MADIVGLEEVLGRLDARLTATRTEPRALFDQFDADRDGALDAAELKGMIRKLLPGLRADEMRFALAHVFEHLGDEVGETAAAAAAAAAAGGGGGAGAMGTVTFAAFNDAIRAFRGGVPVTLTPSS